MKQLKNVNQIPAYASLKGSGNSIITVFIKGKLRGFFYFLSFLKTTTTTTKSMWWNMLQHYFSFVFLLRGFNLKVIFIKRKKYVYVCICMYMCVCHLLKLPIHYSHTLCSPAFSHWKLLTYLLSLEIYLFLTFHVSEIK